jgi:hypothetical protein
MNTENNKIVEELKEISPFLAKLKMEQTEFLKPEIPEQYFDKLTESIFEQTILQPKAASNTVEKKSPTRKKSTIQIFFERLLQPNFAVLSMAVVLLIVAGVYLVNHPQTDDMNVEFTAAEIESYVVDNIESFDLEQLADLVVLENVEELEVPELQDAVLEDYIEENFLEDVMIDDLM